MKIHSTTIQQTHLLMKFAELTLNLYKGMLSERRFEVMKRVLLEQKTIETVAKELGLKPRMTLQIYTLTLHTLERWIRDSDPLIEFHKKAQLAMVENDLLKTEIEDLKSNIDEQQKIPLIHITDMHLSVRAFNCLSAGKMNYLHMIVQSSKREILKYRHIGVKTVREIEEVLAKYGYKLKD